MNEEIEKGEDESVRSEIVSICPADGWMAIFECDEKEISTPVACWAIMKDTEIGITYFVGIVTNADIPMECASWPCEFDDRFRRYERI
jgi:hypothetical protein